MTEQGMDSRIAWFLRRPYERVVIGDPENGYMAKAPELPGCITEGDDEHEALAMLRDAMAGWFELALARGIPIPEPRALKSPDPAPASDLVPA